MENAAGPRDGYFVDPTNLIQFDNAQSFIKCVSDCISDDTIWNLLDKTRTILKATIANAGSIWYPNFPVEWRIITVDADTTDVVLEHLTPGRYVSFEIVNLRDVREERNVHASVFASLETAWNTVVAGGTPAAHHGKEWGYATLGSLPRPYPFQNNAMANRFYSSATRSAFISVMNSYDPTGVFRAGEGLRLLGLVSTKFDTRNFGQESSQFPGCTTWGNSWCFSGCCNKDNIFVNFNQCTEKKSGLFGKCYTKCQCTGGRNCILGICL